MVSGQQLDEAAIRDDMRLWLWVKVKRRELATANSIASCVPHYNRLPSLSNAALNRIN